MGSPYPNLVLGYHTGVDIGANTTYGGVQFFNDHPSVSSTLLMSIGNGNSDVAVTNNIDIGGNARALSLTLDDQSISKCNK